MAGDDAPFAHIKPTKTGHRSSFEGAVARFMVEAGVPFGYETERIPYMDGDEQRYYVPDFILPSGIIIEAKGWFPKEQRNKMLLVKYQHPKLDIRLVFQRASTKLHARMKATYADWCRNAGFLFAEKLPPLEWLRN